MAIHKLLIANRGEIAIRIAQTAAEMDIETVGVFSGDDADSLHCKSCDVAVPLAADGPRAYLDKSAIIAIARQQGCDAVHPGYGFLSENAEFAAAITEAGLIFVGPEAGTIQLFGDKVAAKRAAVAQNVPVIDGVDGPASLQMITGFYHSLPKGAGLMIKAVAGGGGRGMRIVHDAADISAAFAACQAEAQQAFGNPDLYAERVIENARHVEIQIIGDGTGAVIHMGDRECTLQRRHQKIIEIAPSPSLSQGAREDLCAAALRIAKACRYRGVGTFEFLLEGPTQTARFIEANPRLQVEHTITEELFGVDLVRLQLGIAAGKTLDDLGLTQAQFAAPKGFALQCRITMERLDAQGGAQPSNGAITTYSPPGGPGIRVDGFGYSGYVVNSNFDPLLAKLILHSAQVDYAGIVAKAARAMRDFTIHGIDTNIAFLRALLDDENLKANKVTTGYVTDALPRLLAAIPQNEVTSAPKFQTEQSVPDGLHGIFAPIQGILFSLLVTPGDKVAKGQPIAVLEAMKMEHVITADCAGEVTALQAETGKSLTKGTLIATISPDGSALLRVENIGVVDLDHIRLELTELRRLTSFGLDEMRPEAVAKRKKLGKNTARENLAQLCDPQNFEEYGALALAAQSRRRSHDDLVAKTTGDGIITGFGDVNSDLFGDTKTRCALAIYDYMVLAGTQGHRNHQKQDRLFELALRRKTPLILFGEGGGGRPGDTDHNVKAGLDLSTFATFAALSGKVPLIGVVSGRCFAGNAALVGCCDVIIATEDSNLGMAGPAMIEGGGLGRFRPEDIGPIEVQTQNGVVDIRVRDEVEACKVAKQYLSYLQGAFSDWQAPDQRLLRAAIPENRKQVYDVHQVIDALADVDTVLELRGAYGRGIITAFIRIEGRAYGVMASNCAYLGGAIDGDAALKAARFMTQCQVAGLPIISLCDTPGFLVGPEVEKAGQVRNVCQMFLAAANLTVPVFGVVLRKGYGLGAMAMVGGGFHENVFTIAWPTGEFGAMGLEGAVQLGYRKELEAVTDPMEKQALFDQYLAVSYAEGKATSMASSLEIDAVIDPAETRRWIANSAR